MSAQTLSFARRLNSWYRRHARDLPWRQTQDPYKIWISEVMLQQTTVTAVIPYYEKWIRRFPDIRSVAATGEQEILKMWEGLGYYQRARNLHRASRMIMAEYDGHLPQRVGDLRRLPGFGPYTTGAVLSIAFDQRHPIIDANFRRVFMRWLGKEGPATIIQDGGITEVLMDVMPQRNLRTFNQALMELGALVCKNKEPLCHMCPLRNDCRAYASGMQEIIPSREKKEFVELDVAIAVASRRGRYFIQQRSAQGLLAGLWEFPGGKLECGETPTQALVRELREELDVEADDIVPFMRTRHFYTRFRVHLHVFTCRFRGKPRPAGDHRWISKAGFKDYPMPSGSAKIVDKILKEC